MALLLQIRLKRWITLDQNTATVSQESVDRLVCFARVGVISCDPQTVVLDVMLLHKVWCYGQINSQYLVWEERSMCEHAHFIPSVYRTARSFYFACSQASSIHLQAKAYFELYCHR